MEKSVVDILKETLSSLREKNIIATPKNYSKQFYMLAEKSNTNIKEFQLFKDTIKFLDEDEQLLIEQNKYNTYTELSTILLNRCSKSELKGFISILTEIMLPSINYDIEEKIENIISDLEKNPKELISEVTKNKLKQITNERIDLDRLSIKEKANDIIKLTTLMGKYFDKSLIQSGNVTDEINVIKTELEELNLSKSSNREVGILQSKLIDTVYNLEHSIIKNQKELIQSQNDFSNLQKTIETLELNLQKEKKEKNIDYLTGLINRRAYETQIEKFEDKYKLFDSSYAIIFFDIDHFKKINDTHGHECGDVILKIFSKILKTVTRDEDKVIRYGGEEFISLVRYDSQREIVKYAKRVKNIVEKNNFVYKDKRIKVEFSAGISFRNKYSTYEEAVNKSDSLLYKGKSLGRNRIMFDDDTVI